MVINHLLTGMIPQATPPPPVADFQLNLQMFTWIFWEQEWEDRRIVGEHQPLMKQIPKNRAIIV